MLVKKRPFCQMKQPEGNCRQLVAVWGMLKNWDENGRFVEDK